MKEIKIKYISPPNFPDATLHSGLAANKRLRSYPLLNQSLGKIINAFVRYESFFSRTNGVTKISALGLQAALGNALIKHYEEPPDSLSPHLDQMRKQLSPDSCPMCGAKNPSTLDHIIPKTAFPEFSLFSKNLVPACICNSLRENVYVSVSSLNEHVLHPYFDKILSNRLAIADIRVPIGGDKRSHKIGIKIITKSNSKYFPRVQLHINSVVRKTNIVNYISNRWVKLCRNPYRLLQIPKRNLRLNNLVSELKIRLRYEDNYHDTPNNWESFLWAGILKSTSATKFLKFRADAISSGLADPKDY